jgi:hypothetical protein
MNLSDLLTKASELLKGEPARVIGYGGAVIVYLVANFVGAIPDMTIDAALINATAAIATIATVIELIRHLVVPVAKSEAAVKVALYTPVPDAADELPFG